MYQTNDLLSSFTWHKVNICCHSAVIVLTVKHKVNNCCHSAEIVLTVMTNNVVNLSKNDRK